MPEAQGDTSGPDSHKFTARSLTEKCLARADAIDQKEPAINAIVWYAAHLSRSPAFTSICCRGEG
jgi:hypothetical protein